MEYEPRAVVKYSGPYFDGSEVDAACEALKSGDWFGSGHRVDRFERAFSKKFEFASSLMVNSGSSANLVMLAALKAICGWSDGDEVAVSVVGFPTTVAPIVQNGLKPIFIDVSLDDLNWDLEDLARKITPRTVAAFSSPVLGNPYDFDRFLEIAGDNDISYVADNCDSLGSRWKGKLLTDKAVAASTSFYPAHHMTTLEGGMVSSNDEEVVTVARQFAWWGRDCYCVGRQNLLSNGTCGERFSHWLPGVDSEVDHKYVFSRMGYNLKPLDLQGAIGSVQLLKFDEIHSKRRANFDRIKALITATVPGVRVVTERPEAETSWFGVPIIARDSSIKSALQRHLERSGIQTRNYFAGNLLLHPGYRHLGVASDYPAAQQVLERVFFLGCHPGMTESDFNLVETALASFSSA